MGLKDKLKNSGIVAAGAGLIVGASKLKDNEKVINNGKKLQQTAKILGTKGKVAAKVVGSKGKVAAKIVGEKGKEKSHQLVEKAANVKENYERNKESGLKPSNEKISEENTINLKPSDFKEVTDTDNVKEKNIPIFEGEFVKGTSKP